MTGILRLSFAHHVHHLDATQDRASGFCRLESEHRSDPSFDGTMILFDPIVEVGTLPDLHRLQFAPRAISKPVFRIAGQNGLPVGLAPVDDYALRPTMPLERLAQKPFGGGEVSPLAEPEFDRVAVAVDGAVEIRPTSTDFDVRLIHMPSPADGSLASIEPLEKLG